MSIPASIQVSAAVARRSRYEGELPLKLLPRVAELAAAPGEPLKVELEAGREIGFPGLKGSIRGTLHLQCQRCEKSFAWELETEVDLRLVSSEEEEKEALGASDPYLVQDDTLHLRELVEDEVLLALPMLVRCESCENSGPERYETGPEQARQEEPVKVNPFAALKGQLKH